MTETTKSPPQDKARGQFYRKKKGKKKFYGGQRGTPQPGQGSGSPQRQGGTPQPGQGGTPQQRQGGTPQPGQRGASQPGQRVAPQPAQRSTPKGQKPAMQPGSPARFTPSGKQQAIPAAPAQVRREIKIIGAMAGGSVLLLLVLSQLLPRGAYLQAGLISFLFLVFLLLAWRTK